MKINNIPVGSVFTIGETPTYPKLRTKMGYIDLRDEIVNNNPNQAVLNADCRELSVEELAKVFETTQEDITSWLLEKNEKFEDSL